MQITRIKFFLAVVISETFSEAAEMMYTTQASVSKQVMALEKELGVQLFDRSRRKVQLTAAGRIFLEYAKRMLDVYNEMNASLGELEESRSRQTIVASIPVMAPYGIINMISKFRERFPHINLIVDEREASDIMHGLEDGQYEMAFMRRKGLDPAQYQQIELIRDRLAVLLPEDHPLSARQSVSVRELSDETFLMLGRHTGLYEFCVDICRQYGGFTPRIGYTGTHMDSIAEMVGKNMGISLMMEIPARYVSKGRSRVIPVEEDIGSSIVLTRLRKTAPSAAGSDFWGFFRAWSARRSGANESV